MLLRDRPGHGPVLHNLSNGLPLLRNLHVNGNVHCLLNLLVLQDPLRVLTRLVPGHWNLVSHLLRHQLLAILDRLDRARDRLRSLDGGRQTGARLHTLTLRGDLSLNADGHRLQNLTRAEPCFHPLHSHSNGSHDMTVNGLKNGLRLRTQLRLRRHDRLRVFDINDFGHAFVNRDFLRTLFRPEVLFLNGPSLFNCLGDPHFPFDDPAFKRGRSRSNNDGRCFAMHDGTTFISVGGTRQDECHCERE